MIPGLTSIIIPTYNHADYVEAAIASALEQSAQVQVIVVDDGSTDGTLETLRRIILHRADSRLLLRTTKHRGVAEARNYGIELATGEYVMFLDADDDIESDKVERQLREMQPDVGFVLCDVRIIGVDGDETTAAARYGYADMLLTGWIADLLIGGNFIPVMSPLVRRDVLGAHRFRPGIAAEDWHFWHALASVSRCAYVDAVLATYRKRPGGRNEVSKTQPAKAPGVEAPLRLNLGCGKRGARSWHPVRGLVNLDASMGWRFEDGLRQFESGSVDGITISHALMYVRDKDWPAVFAEFARVLKRGGVLRITEDDTSAPESRTYGRGWHDAVTLTNPAMVRRYMQYVGFTVYDVNAEATRYGDRSLCQSQHGEPPHVFYVEGVRECSVLLSPHQDDETLFAAFTIIRHRPQVVVCFPSTGDYGSTHTRTEESRRAVAILGGGPVVQWDGLDLVEKMRELDGRIRPTIVFAPSEDASHAGHVAVAKAAASVFGNRLRKYHTYNGPNGGKVRTGSPVAFEPEWVDVKRRALACYESQIRHVRARIFFDDDLAEYAP